jgi:hypothetical protein
MIASTLAFARQAAPGPTPTIGRLQEMACQGRHWAPATRWRTPRPRCGHCGHVAATADTKIGQNPVQNPVWHTGVSASVLSYSQGTITMGPAPGWGRHLAGECPHDRRQFWTESLSIDFRGHSRNQARAATCWPCWGHCPSPDSSPPGRRLRPMARVAVTGARKSTITSAVMTRTTARASKRGRLRANGSASPSQPRSPVPPRAAWSPTPAGLRSIVAHVPAARRVRSVRPVMLRRGSARRWLMRPVAPAAALGPPA